MTFLIECIGCGMRVEYENSVYDLRQRRTYCHACYAKLPVKREQLQEIKGCSYSVTVYRDHMVESGTACLICFITDYDPKQYWGGDEKIIAEGKDIECMTAKELLRRYEQEIIAAVKPFIPDLKLNI